jgi:hypothetical protein
MFIPKKSYYFLFHYFGCRCVMLSCPVFLQQTYNEDKVQTMGTVGFTG